MKEDNLEVLLINTGLFPLPPERPAGTEFHIYHLANNLAKLGCHVHLVTEIKNKEAFHPSVTLHDFRIKKITLKGGFASWLLLHFIGGFHSFIKTLEVLPKHYYTVIHLHGRLAPMLISRIPLGAPTVYTIHDMSPWLWKGKMNLIEEVIRKTSYLAMELQTMKKVSHIIAVSKTIYNELLKSFQISPEKVTYIPNGVDTNYFKPAKYKQPIILYAGRLSRRKNVKTLIKAFADFKHKNRDRECKLVIVGEGEEKTHLVKLTKRFNITNNVVFLTNISSRQLRTLYSFASIYVLPSKAEGLPLSMLEAMASGCAIIATKVPGIVDVVEHGSTGLLVEPDNVKQLAQALEQLLSDPNLRRRLSTNAREVVIREYSWDRVAEKTIKVYRRVIEEHWR